MAVGDWHTFPNGYTYQETLHGPLDWGTCVDCGERAAEALCNRGKVVLGVPPTRCGACLRKRHQVGATVYELHYWSYHQRGEKSGACSARPRCRTEGR